MEGWAASVRCKPPQPTSSFPNFICKSLFVRLDCVRVTHRVLSLGVPQSILPNCHRRPDLIEQRGPHAESMETTLRNA